MNNYRQTANKANSGKITALYERLSRDDELLGLSVSIKNQMEILENYAAKHGFGNTRHFQDDGVTGTVFRRPGLDAMLEEVQAGNVAVVIIKDQSRIGRDVVEVGLLKRTFEKYDVRFIAAEDNLDTANGFDIMSIFRDVFNEWFVADTSKKIKAVAHAKGNAGKPLSYNAIYGYKRSPDDKNVWLIDEGPAEVVRRIFQMTLDGMGPFQIARKLTEEKVERPSYYFAAHLKTSPKPVSRDLSKPYSWCGSTIVAMLKKPEYDGHTVNFRTYKKSYKDKQSKWNPKEDWKIFPNTHEAIIDQETFDTVQRLRGTPRRVDKLGEANPLTGIVFCAQCGAKMYNSRQAKAYYEERRFGKVYKHKTADFYTCSTNDLASGAFKVECSKHFIRTEVIRDLVLDTIRRVSGYVRENEAEFVEKIREASNVRQEETAKAHKKQIAKNERRIAELDTLFRKVYEDNATGKLSDERFAQLSGSYEDEQSSLKVQNAALQAEVDAFAADNVKADRFIEIVRRYTVFDELTTPMLNEFVEKILVHEADKSSGQRVQQVDIHLNFIGKFDLPMEEPKPLTPEELEAQEKCRRKLEYQRAANRRWYAKKKQEEDRQKAMQAGEIPAPTSEEIQASEIAKQERERVTQEERLARKRERARTWARRRRERMRAERAADIAAADIAMEETA